MKYESPVTYHSMLKFFADRQTDRRTGQKIYAPYLLIWGHKK
jgi:hypothetical protein